MMRHTTIRWMALGAASLMLVSGCSGGQSNPAKVAEKFLHAMAEKDSETVCEVALIDDKPMTTKEDRQACAALLTPIFDQEAAAELARYAHAKVERAEVDGDTATVPSDAITGVLGVDEDVHLQRIDGKWYVAEGLSSEI